MHLLIFPISLTFRILLHSPFFCLSKLFRAHSCPNSIVFVEYGGCAVVLLVMVMVLTKSVEFVASPSAPSKAQQELKPLLTSTPARDGDDEEEDKLLGSSSEQTARKGGSVPISIRASTSGTTPAAAPKGLFGMTSKSRMVVLQLSLLFATDSFGGGLVTGTLIAYYFQVRAAEPSSSTIGTLHPITPPNARSPLGRRSLPIYSGHPCSFHPGHTQVTYGVSDSYLGGILFGANIIAGVI